MSDEFFRFVVCAVSLFLGAIIGKAAIAAKRQNQLKKVIDVLKVLKS